MQRDPPRLFGPGGSGGVLSRAALRALAACCDLHRPARVVGGEFALGLAAEDRAAGTLGHCWAHGRAVRLGANLAASLGHDRLDPVGLGVAAGFAFGAAVALVPAIERLVYPYMVAFQTVPKVAIAPLFILWFGYGLMSKVVIAALVCFFPVLVSVMSAFHTTDRDQLDMMRACGASGWQTFIHLRIRAALPIIFNGLEIAAVFAVIGAVVGEFVGAQAGLGYLITTLNFNLDVPGVFAVLILLSLLGIILHDIVRRLGRRLVFWIRSEPVNH